jgi:hypothetical protein
MSDRVDPRDIADLIGDSPDAGPDGSDAGSEQFNVSNSEPVRFNRAIYTLPGVAARIEQALDEALDQLVADGIISNAQSYELIEKWPLD